jgi:NADPH:quinone reductase-like Zn-dependent oxidoreductase
MAHKIVFDRTGGADVLRIAEIATPVPGAEEVRILVRAIGINRAEVNFRAGTHGQPAGFPAQLGFEAAGQVDALGANVSGFEIGDAVSIVPSFTPSQYGMYGDSVLAPARAVVKHPAHLSWIEAAGTWMSFGTAWTGLIHHADTQSGDVVLINAATSSVGLAAIQVARRAGALPIALTRRADKALALLAAGAEHVVVTTEQDTVKELSRLTKELGARVVFDAVGGPAFADLMTSAAVGGILVIYGVLSGEMSALPAIQAIRKGLTIRGIAASALDNDATLASLKAYVLSGLEANTLQPNVSKTFPFADMASAHRHVESNKHFGKVVVTV